MDRNIFQLQLLAVVLIAPRYGSASTVYVKRVQEKEVIDLNDIVKCDSWKFEENVMKMPLNVTRLSTGAYICPSGGDVVLLVAYVTVVLGHLPELAFHTENLNITVVCFVEFWARTMQMVSSLTLFSGDDKLMAATGIVEKSSERKGLSVIGCNASFTTSAYGDFPHRCNWNLEINYEGQIYKDTMDVNRTVVIHLPVRNVKPDKTEVKTYEAVICTAEGHPPPHYFSWMCTEVSWFSRGEVLNLMRAKKYKCTCTAENDVPSDNYREVWNGIIEAVPHEGYGSDDEGKDEDYDATDKHYEAGEEDEADAPSEMKRTTDKKSFANSTVKTTDIDVLANRERKTDKIGIQKATQKPTEKKEEVGSGSAILHDLVVPSSVASFIAVTTLVAMAAKNRNDPV